MRQFYQTMIPRLDGEDIAGRYAYCLSLVKKGVAGFIIFGGEMETVRRHVHRLQHEAELPLIISSDLERGLGQQLKGGTLFPPAMALAAAYSKLSAVSGQQSAIKILRKSFKALAEEAKYAGINTILAPVLDINTNPKNPIISVRAFGDDVETVSLLGAAMIKTLQKNGVAACGKHFPGHGDTSVDSHIRLPVLIHDLKRLKRCELRPFTNAIAAKAGMLMLGHLSVPALDPSGLPASFSKAVTGYLRREMGFDGLLITDALNMAGLGRYSEQEASAMALEAGIDLLLHPSDPDAVASYLQRNRVLPDTQRLVRFRRRLKVDPGLRMPSFAAHRDLCRKLTHASITTSGDIAIKGSPLFVLLDDDVEKRGRAFSSLLKKGFPEARVFLQESAGNSVHVRKKANEFMIVALFSGTKAWKGGAGRWLLDRVRSLAGRADLFISFGSPYLLKKTGNIPGLFAYWDADPAQEAVINILSTGSTGYQ